MDAITLFVAALTTARVTRLIVEDRITEAPRHAILRRLSPEGLPAYLLTCSWCVSVYAGGAVAGAGAWAGLWSWWWAIPLALTFSYIAGWLAAREGE